MQIKDHILEGIKFLKSPNFNERPLDTKISLLVIHAISLPPGKYNTNHIEEFFTNKLDFSSDDYYHNIKNLRVSAHILIKRSGEIIQLVPFNKRAWHAGSSSFMGKENCNDYSIGIELEGSDDDIFEDIQYDKLNKVTRTLMNQYTLIDKSNIKGHSDVAPGRKTDPGNLFDWNRYLNGL